MLAQIRRNQFQMQSLKKIFLDLFPNFKLRGFQKLLRTQGSLNYLFVGDQTMQIKKVMLREFPKKTSLTQPMANL